MIGCLPHNPALETIGQIQALGIPIVAMWFDTNGPGRLDWSEWLSFVGSMNGCEERKAAIETLTCRGPGSPELRPGRL